MITHNTGAQNDDKQPKKGLMNMANTSNPDKKDGGKGTDGSDGRKMSHKQPEIADDIINHSIYGY